MDMEIIWPSFLENNFFPEGLAQGESMGLLEYQAIPSLRDVAHDGVFEYLVIDQPRELQRDVAYLGRPIAPSYMSPNRGGRGRNCGVSATEYSCTQEPK